MTSSPRQFEWENFSAFPGVDPAQVRAMYEVVMERYAEPDRYYHNLFHIIDVLKTINALKEQAVDLPAIELAAWFHDVVYDSRAKDNEEKSAAFARESLVPLGVSEKRIAAVERMILSTKTHKADDIDARILIDADLAILGESLDAYRRYAEAIRKEYSWVPEDAYRTGRAQVLESFLSRERIYFTEKMFEARENEARANLGAELRELQG